MKYGFTASTFDLLHAGHVLMLEEAKSNCDFLTACLQVDPTVDRPEKNRPIQSVFERQVQLLGCKYVDAVLVYCTEEDLCDIIRSYKWDIRFLGNEYRDKPLDTITGADICSERGIELYFNQRAHRWSSSELRHRIDGGKGK